MHYKLKITQQSFCTVMQNLNVFPHIAQRGTWVARWPLDTRSCACLKIQGKLQ